jgi:hypothetical protein
MKFKTKWTRPVRRNFCRRGGQCRLLTRARLIELAEIHAVGKLQAGDLTGVVLYFEVSLKECDMDLLPLHGIVALGTSAVEGEVTVVRFHKFPDHVVHGNADSQSHVCALKSCKYLRTPGISA